MENSPTPPPYASFWRRALALLIDGIILALLIAVLGYAFEKAWTATEWQSWNYPEDALPFALFMLALLIATLYNALWESSEYQATPGKMALGLRVVDLHTRPPGFWRALGRAAARYLSAALIFLGYLMAAFTRRRQTLHDLIAGTLVLHGPVSKQ